LRYVALEVLGFSPLRYRVLIRLNPREYSHIVKELLMLANSLGSCWFVVLDSVLAVIPFVNLNPDYSL
jgi:hypothetical protein